MFSNRLTFGVLAIACIAAAGAGGYFASRQNTVPTPAVAAEQPLPASEGLVPVQETEAVVENRGERAAQVDAQVDAAEKTNRVETTQRAPAAAARSTRATTRPAPPALD